MKVVAWMAHYKESQEMVGDYIERVAGCLGGHEFVICLDQDSIRREIVDADALVCWRMTPEVLTYAKRLRWVQFGSTGIDHSTFPELLASGVILTTMRGVHAAPVAEHVMALMLAMTRRLDLAMRLQTEHRFERSEVAWSSDELSEKTLGIVGLGMIGMEIARRAKAFGMRVIGTKRIVAPLQGVDRVLPPEKLRDMLPEVDYLVLVAPLTDDTREMIGRREIELMKDGSYLINVARGAMLDYDALGEALRSGKLAGAALDVFLEEPLPSDSPIYEFPNTIITPHTAGSNKRYGARGAEVFRRNLEAFVSGGEMVNVYQRGRGY